jgi:hypothetical protein
MSESLQLLPSLEVRWPEDFLCLEIGWLFLSFSIYYQRGYDL